VRWASAGRADADGQRGPRRDHINTPPTHHFMFLYLFHFGQLGESALGGQRRSA
jgi:hypothetical protein